VAIFSRRSFIKLITAAGTLPLGVGSALAYARNIEPWRLSVERVTLQSARVPRELAGLKIGHISDLHLGSPIGDAFVKRAVRELAALKPDLVVLTGDLVHYSGLAPRLAAVLQDFRAPLGSYITFGNHDHWNDAAAITTALSESGHLLLNNARQSFHINGTPLHLVGVDDIWERKHDLNHALGSVPHGEPAVLLAHEPDFADEAAARFPFIAQLSGHTHGGQVRLPIRGDVARVPFGRKYVMGRFVINGMQLYVTRGIGMSAPYFRFLCPPEVTLLTLQTT
jgi:hypothetical protein